MIRADGEEALMLNGRDVGTPNIHFEPPDGVVLFGPVISRRQGQRGVGPRGGLGRFSRVHRAEAQPATAAAAGGVRRDALGISQPTVSQQLRYAPDLEGIHPVELLEAAASVLKALAADHDYRQLAVFGSVARGEASQDSDIDLVVDAPPGTSSFAFIRFKQLIEQVLGREIDLISYGA